MPNSLFNRISLILTQLHALRNRKDDLEEKIASEQSRLAPNAQQLHWLRVRRLMVGEQIERHETTLNDLKNVLFSGKGQKEVAA